MRHLRTNSKEFKTKVREYILSNIDGEPYGKELKTDKEKLQFILDCFSKEFYYEYNQKRYPNKVRAFAEYLMGLPTVFNVEYRNHAIIELAKKWGSYKDTSNMTEKQIERYEDTILENWFSLIASNFFELLEKE